MPDVPRGNLDVPDEVIEFPKIAASLVELGDLTVGMMVAEPGWRWSVHNRPKVGGEWCQARHVGVVLSGRLGIDFSDGTMAQFGPNDVFDIPPGHDGYTVGDKPCVNIEWAGLRAWAGFPTGIHSRVLRTMLSQISSSRPRWPAGWATRGGDSFSPSTSSAHAPSSSAFRGAR